jgi:hypothetical protein
MMNQSLDFTQLARWQQSAMKNKALLRVLHESAEDVLEGKCTPLSLAFHEASVAAVYQQFGFVVFSPESRRLLSLELSKQTRIASRLVLEWLDHAAYQQLADFHVLRYLDSEPDWLDLSQDFCTAVVKRIVVCRPQEWGSVGLIHYPSEVLSLLMRAIDQQMMSLRQGLAVVTGVDLLNDLREEMNPTPQLNDMPLEVWGKSIDTVLRLIEADPLRLLAWRLEAFSTERQLQNDARLAVIDMSAAELENKSLAVIALMSVLSGIDVAGSGVLVSETPVTLTSLVKSLGTLSGTESPQSQLLRGLMGLTTPSCSINSTVGEILRTGEHLGVFQWTAVGKGQRGILLTSLAFLVLDPYTELICSTFSGRDEAK